jgi:hypothetical protein
MRPSGVPFLSLGLAVLCLILCTFHLLWVRQSIARDASRLASLESRLLSLQDNLRLIEGKVDDAMQPDVLRQRVEGLMVHPAEGQVIRVDGAAALRQLSQPCWAADRILAISGKEGA